MTKLIIKNDTTPATPDSGTTAVYVSSTSKRLVSKNDAGVETAYGASGSGGAADAVNSATTEIDLVSATAPSADQVLTATSSTAATWQTPSTEATGLINGFGTTSIDSEAAAPTAGQILIANSATDMSWQAAPSSGATDIDGLSDAASDGSSYFFGTDSGLVDDGTTNQNIGIGVDTLKANTSGFDNVAIGGTALAANIIGQKNFAVGAGALRYATGSYNTAIGFNASHRQTTPSTNTSIGTNAGMNNATGGSNTAIGFQALTGVNGNSSTSNTALGYNAGAPNTTGGSNTYIGTSTAATGTTGSRNILLGYAIDLPSAATDDYLSIGDIITGDISVGNVSTLGVFGAGQFATGSLPAAASFEGFIAYDTTTNEVKFSDGATWAAFGGGSSGNVFETIDTSSGSDPVAIGSTDTLTLKSDDSSIVVNGLNANNSVSFEISTDITIESSGVNGVPLSARGVASQVVNLFEVEDSLGTNVFEVAIDGVLSSAPLSAGQYATGSIPAAASFEGYTVYDTTTNEVKFSDGSTWAAFGGGGSTVYSNPNVLYTASEIFGASATVTGNNGSSFGSSADAGSGSTSIGAASGATGVNSVAIGYLSVATGNNCISIGRSATASANGISLGRNAACAGSDALALGYSALASQQYGISIGKSATSVTFQGIALGAGSTLTKSNQMVIGGTLIGITEMVIGSGVTSATPAALTITNTHGVGTDIAGADITFKAGNGTGTGGSGDFLFQTAAVDGTGSAINTLATTAKLTNAGQLLLEPNGFTPTFSFIGAETSGIGINGSGGDMWIRHAGNNMFFFASTSINVYQKMVCANDGTTSAPVIHIGGAGNNTGLYNSDAVNRSKLSVTAEGLQAFEFDGTSATRQNTSFFPLKFAEYATGSLPTASAYEGSTVYDTTTNELKYSDGSTWDGLSGSGTPVTIPSAIPAAAAFAANKVQYYITEGANSLNFKMKYADGTTKRAKLPLYEAPDWANAKQYTLDNTDDYFTSEITGEELGLSGATAFTISVIVDFDMVANDEFTWLSLFAGTGTGKLEIYRINSVIRFIIDGAYTDIAPTRIDGLYHLVFVYDGGLASDILRAKIYHNGSDATTTGSGTIPASVNVEIADSQLGIGNRYSPGANYYDGSIQEMSIYNRALTSTEVTDLYNSGSYADPTAVSGCVSSWWFGDNPSDNRVKVVDNIGYNDLTGVNLDSGVITTI